MVLLFSFNEAYFAHGVPDGDMTRLGLLTIWKGTRCDTVQVCSCLVGTDVVANVLMWWPNGPLEATQLPTLIDVLVQARVPSCLWFNLKFWLVYGGSAGVVCRRNICGSA